MKKQYGLTLLEITVVLLILLALAGLAVPYVSGVGSNALCQATDVTMHNIKKAIMDGFYQDTLGYFPKGTKAGTDYNLSYLLIAPSDSISGGWNSFDPETGIGWRGPYLQSGVTLATIPNDSFKAVNGKVHVDITGQQVLDGWGRPIVLQEYAANLFRLVSAGPGDGIGNTNADIDTTITGARANDDRVLHLNSATPNDNPSCD